MVNGPWLLAINVWFAGDQKVDGTQYVFRSSSSAGDPRTLYCPLSEVLYGVLHRMSVGVNRVNYPLVN